MWPITLLDEREACLLLNVTLHGRKGKNDSVHVQAQAFKKTVTPVISSCVVI